MLTKQKLANRINNLVGTKAITNVNVVSKKNLLKYYDELLDINKKTVTRKQAENIIRNSKGKGFLSVNFIKADNSIRKMVGLTGVSKYVTGEGKRFNDKDRGIQTLWEPNHPVKGKQQGKNAYASFKYERLQSFQLNGQRYEVV